MDGKTEICSLFLLLKSKIISLNFNCVCSRRPLNKSTVPCECGRCIFGQCGQTGSSPSRLFCQDYTLQLHKTAEPLQTSKTCPYVDKNGRPRAAHHPHPPDPHLPPCPDPFTATGSTPKSPLFRVSVALADQGPPEVGITSVSCFCDLPAGYL